MPCAAVSLWVHRRHVPDYTGRRGPTAIPPRTAPHRVPTSRSGCGLTPTRTELRRVAGLEVGCWLGFAPGAAVAGDEGVGFGGSPGARFVAIGLGGGILRPRI